MIITINETIRISIEDDNYTIQSKVKSKKEDCKERWKTEGYFPTMLQCAEELLDMLPARSSTLTGDVSTLINEIKKAKSEIISAIK